jgi:hypothetical protein
MILGILFLLAYLIPGLYIARGMYSEQIRQIRNTPVNVVPPKPQRPRITMNEMLHTSSGRGCSILNSATKQACNCRYRDEWVQLKNDWKDYEEWTHNYGHIKNGVPRQPSPNALMCYGAVPAWPLFLAGMFITGGTKNIPDYREIERLERETFPEYKEII